MMSVEDIVTIQVRYWIHALRCLTLEMQKMKIVKITNGEDPNETAHNESPCHDLHCLTLNSLFAL